MPQHLTYCARSRTVMLARSVIIVNFLFVSSLLFASPIKAMKQNQFNEPIKLNSDPVLLKSDPAVTDPIQATKPAEPIDLHNSLTIYALPDFIAENEPFLKQINSELSQHMATKPVEIGFITKPSSDATFISVHVAKIRLVNKQKYAINFDGSKLVYFDLATTVAPSDLGPQPSNSIFFHRKSLFSNVGRVSLAESIQGIIMDNAINKEHIREANYISVNQGRIFLDTKEVIINQQNEMAHSIKQTVAAINNRDRHQKSARLLDIVWKPRHR
ncbi:MAG: hypothetical protein ACHP65_03340 [Legionellales bacterium]